MEKEVKLRPILVKELGVFYLNENSKRKRRYNLYKCGFCGNEFKAEVHHINSGATISCGCYKSSKLSNRNKTHGLRSTRLYSIWGKIKDRILNPKNKNYNDYGERGITICDEWKNDFKSFYDWAMTNGYEENKGLSIDRIDNDENYCPENCRWTTKSIQARNTRIQKNNTSGYRGVSYNKKTDRYRAKICVNNNDFYLGSFLTPVEGAVAYNNYIIENNLEGFILNEILG